MNYLFQDKTNSYEIIEVALFQSTQEFNLNHVDIIIPLPLLSL